MTAQVERCKYLSVKLLRKLMIVFVVFVSFPFYIHFTVEFFYL